MSHWASSWAYEQPIKLSGRKFVLVALANFADSEGFCFPGQDTLAVMTGQDVRSVQRHLTELEKTGYITRKHRHKGARRTSDGYTLLANRPLKPNTTNCQVVKMTNTTNCHQDKLSPDPLDHKVDPSVLPPLPPKRKQSHKPPEPEIVLDPPFHSKDFMEALSKFEKVKLEIKSPLTPTSREALYCKLAKFDEETATLALEEAAAGGYKGVYPEKVNGNGNGYHEPKPVQRVQTIRERLGIVR